MQEEAVVVMVHKKFRSTESLLLAYCADLALLVTNFPTPHPLDVTKLKQLLQTLPHKG